MSPIRSRACAWLELMRVSNFATCISNAITGVALGCAANVGPIDGRIATVMSLGIVLLYAAGMILNDLFDRAADSSERPERPIPSGRVSTRAALTAVGVLMGTAVALLALLSFQAAIAALALIATIVLYDWLHQKSAATVVLMGLCRALIYVVGAAAVGWPFDVQLVGYFAAGLLLYTVLLSVVARHEMAPRDTPKRWPWSTMLLPLAPAIPLIIVQPREWIWTLLVGVALIAWLQWAATRLRTNPPRVREAVGAWIAGLCLVDAFFLTLLDRPELVVVAAACFVVTVLAQRRVAGT